MPTETARRRRAAVADAADSVHGERASRWSRCRPVFPVDIPPEQLAQAKLGAAFHAARPESDHRAGHGRRRELRSDLLQPADRPALRERDRQPAQFGTSGRRATSRRSIRRPANWCGSRSSKASARPARSSPPAASCSSAAGSNVAGYFYRLSTRRPASCCGSSTPAPGVFSSPSVYMVNGEQFVTVASGGGERGRRGGDLILSFALPKR